MLLFGTYGCLKKRMQANKKILKILQTFFTPLTRKLYEYYRKNQSAIHLPNKQNS